MRSVLSEGTLKYDYFRSDEYDDLCTLLESTEFEFDQKISKKSMYFEDEKMIELILYKINFIRKRPRKRDRFFCEDFVFSRKSKTLVEKINLNDFANLS